MNKVKRDQIILNTVNKFKVASRNQLAYLSCKENSNPVNVVNRVLKRMTLNGSLTQIQRERDKPYLYMPNPTLIHPRTVKIDHHLKIVDFYIHTGCPKTFIVEPSYKGYNPDVYMKDRMGNAICVEVQITLISTKKMQKKINEFVSSHKEHQANILLLVSDHEYGKVEIPPKFKLVRIPLPKEPYAQKDPS